MIFNKPIDTDISNLDSLWEYFAHTNAFSGNPYNPQDLDKYVELPGVDKKNCQVSFENGAISIEANDVQRDRDRNMEVYVGDIDASTLNAELKDGLLHLTAKKKDQRKKIDIK